MEKEYILDQDVMGTHLSNVRDAIDKAITHNEKNVGNDAASITLQAFFIRNNLDTIKEQVAMAELYIAHQEEEV